MATIPQPRYYVYILARPNGKPFYVGKGQGARVFAHDNEARLGHKCHKCNVIRKIWRNGGEYQRYIVFTTDVERDAHDYEKELIAQFGRDSLCNLTDGGEGCSGRVVDSETRKKLSLAWQRNPNRKTRRGQKSTEEHRRKISEANAGRKRSPEVVERMRRFLTGRKQNLTDEQRQRRSERMKGNQYGIGNPNIWNKGRAWTEEERRRISETLKTKAPWKGKQHTDESIQKMRESQRISRQQRPARFLVIDPQGVEHRVVILKHFCLERNLHYPNVQKALKRGSIYEGWRFSYIE